jgi:death-on-curing protein
LIEPIFLRLDEVIEIHNDQIKRYGGRIGVRDIELLKSAIAMPAVGLGGDYLHTDIYEMAAACLFHIVRNHPFIDGNKRTGAVASVVFLMMNGIELHADEDSFEKMVLSVAEGKSDKATAAKFFRNYTSTMEQTG